MSEQMQPIDPVTAAMLMGQVPDPCEPIIEISRKVLTRLMDVAEFGDHLERVEKDRLLTHLRDVLAEKQPELWAMHSPGPGEVHPVISKEEAERQASELLALFKKQFPEVPITVNVIPSPFSPLEHFEILAEELSEQVTHLHQALDKKTAETPSPAVAMPSGWSVTRDGESIIVRRDQGTAVELNHDGTLGERVMHGFLDAMLAAAPAPSVVNQQLTTAPTVAMPAGLHADTQDLVTRFATALAVKLHAAELKHGYSNGWKDPAWMDECRQKLIEHLTKGDPRDVAAYCAFLWHHCQSTSAPSKSCVWKRDEDTGVYNTACGQTWHFTDGGYPEEHGALFCYHCAGSITVEHRQLFAYQVGDNDIVAAYDPAGARKVLCEFNGYPDDEYEDSEVELVSDKVLDNTEAFDIDEGKTITLDKTLRQELAELTEPAYLHGWE